MVSWVRLECWEGRTGRAVRLSALPPDWVATVDVRRPFLGYRVLDFVWMLKNSQESPLEEVEVALWPWVFLAGKRVLGRTLEGSWPPGHARSTGSPMSPDFRSRPVFSCFTPRCEIHWYGGDCQGFGAKKKRGMFFLPR